MVEIIDGGVTTPQGYKAAGVHSGVKYRSLDLGLVYSEVPATACVGYTSNDVKSAPVQVMMKENSEKLQAVLDGRDILCEEIGLLCLENIFTGICGYKIAYATFIVDYAVGCEFFVNSHYRIGVYAYLRAILTDRGDAVFCLEPAGEDVV